MKTANKLAISSWYSKTDSISRGTVILFHGLMGSKSKLIAEAAEFRDLGYNVLLPDVRAHGKSEGNMISIGYYEAEEVKLAYDYVHGMGEKTIFLYGTSMGAVEILKAIPDYQLQPSGIIIEMPFLSLQSHLEGRARLLGFPEQPFGFFTSFWIGLEKGYNGWGFKTTKYARQVSCPVLMQYGNKDQMVLRYETDAIYESIVSKNKKLVIYEEASHELFLRKDPAVWRKEIKAFLEKWTKVIS
jgi:alpha-beta hydrolase superfamily lysophospholipase